MKTMFRTLAAGLALAAVFSGAQAQSNNAAIPAGPIRMIITTAPAGILDATARLLADRMSTSLKQNVIVENRPGASGNIGAMALQAAPADGSTFLFTLNGLEMANPYLFKRLGYDARKFERISVVYESSIVLAVPKRLNVNNLKEYLAYAKARGGNLTYGSWGVGSSAHLFGQVLQQLAGLEMTQVLYKGETPALLDMTRGDLDMTWASPNGARAYRERGEAVVLGVSGNARSPALPDVPTFAEQGYPDFKLGLYGVAYAPAGTPKPIVDKLQKAIHDAVMQPEVKERFAAMGSLPVGNTPAQFEALMNREQGTWRKLIQASGATLD